MLTELTSENTITLPAEVVSEFEGAVYFDVTKENGCIVLTPAKASHADIVRMKADVARDKIAKLGLTEADVAEVVARVRRQR